MLRSSVPRKLFPRFFGLTRECKTPHHNTHSSKCGRNETPVIRGAAPVIRDAGFWEVCFPETVFFWKISLFPERALFSENRLFFGKSHFSWKLTFFQTTHSLKNRLLFWKTGFPAKPRFLRKTSLLVKNAFSAKTTFFLKSGLSDIKHDFWENPLSGKKTVFWKKSTLWHKTRSRSLHHFFHNRRHKLKIIIYKVNKIITASYLFIKIVLALKNYC